MEKQRVLELRTNVAGIWFGAKYMKSLTEADGLMELHPAGVYVVAGDVHFLVPYSNISSLKMAAAPQVTQAGPARNGK